MGMRDGDRGEGCGSGLGASAVAWSSPRKLLGILAGAVLLLGLALGVWGETTSSAQAAPSQCRTIGGPINYTDSSDRLLAYFYMRQRICWNYSELTFVSQPTVIGKVTQLGATNGWRYDGIIGRRDAYFLYKGVSDGGHKSTREGSFSVCSRGGKCTQVATPKIKIVGLYDRGGYQLRYP